MVTTAVQEEMDVLGISLLSGTHMSAFPNILKLLGESGADNPLLATVDWM